MSSEAIFGLFLGIVFVLFLFVPSFWLFKKIQSQAGRPLWKRVMGAVLFPFNFGALFLEERKIEQLPFYYRWFLRFTEFTSRVQYFHFLPKALIAFSAEAIITWITKEDVLTAIVFSWSILFLLLITWVENNSGEMEKKTIVFANKLFLYTVSMLSLFLIILHSFFWDQVRASFETPFWRMMAWLAHEFNHLLWITMMAFWNLNILYKLIIIFILLVYIFSFMVFGKKKTVKKSAERTEEE